MRYTSAKFQAMFHPGYIENSKPTGQTVDLDEAAQDELPHQDLHCLQIQLFSSLALKVQIFIPTYVQNVGYITNDSLCESKYNGDTYSISCNQGRVVQN